ncbi:MAG TPA: efflux RND transporter permease subunit [Vicinamibacteria bacterium]|nr:efflux RND transporter permease subunit [Vicinamibacteria bacterium]
MTLLRRSHQRATAIFLLVAILAAAGLFLALDLPSSIFPSVTFPLVKVIADVGEEPAARMMPTVTRRLEEAIHRVVGVRRVLSTTSRGSTEIAAEFFWGTDMQVALQRVQAEVQRIRPDLPADARIDVEWMNTSVFPVLGYALTSDSRAGAELWDLAEFGLKPRLIRIPGVSQVQIQGGRRREFQVRLDAQGLAGRKLSPADVVDAIRKNNQIQSAGLIEQNHELYLSLVDGRARGLATLSQIAIPVPGGGVPVRLGDLGSIAAGEAVSYIRTTANGRPAVLINIIQQPSANTLTIAQGVADLVKAHPELLPPDVHWSTFYDQAEFIQSSVHGVREAILIGVALAALVLFFFLRDLRVTLVAVATIPLAVALVLLGLAVCGQTVNLMTLGGIAAAIGLVADDAIVVVENIHRHRETGASPDPAQSGTAEILPPLIGSSLSTIVVFLPFALLAGVAGAFFRPLALTMSLALLVSFLLSAFVVPVAARVLERRGGREPVPSTPSRFARLVQFLLRHASVAAVLVLVLLAGGAVLYTRMGTDFLPAMDEGSIILDYWTPPGTALTDTDAMLNEAEKIILSIPDVEGYSRRTGTQLGFFITEPNRGDYIIRLKPRSGRRGVDAVTDDLRQRIHAAEPAIRTDFGQLLEDNIGDLTGGVPQPIDIKVFGEDQATLQEKARRVAEIVRGVQGVEDVFDGIVIAGPALQVRARPLELARHGLTTEDLHEAIQPALVGTVAGDLLIGERVYDIRVFQRPESGLQSLRVRSPSGALLPLETLASLETGPPEAEISRDSLRTYVGVTARLSGRSLGNTVDEIRRKLQASLPLPPGMSIEFGGQYEQQQSSFKGLLGVLVAGLLLVAVILLFEFGDWRAPLLTSLMSITVLTGVFGALMATGMTLNISSFVGAIMMVGIVGENAIFVIHEARQGLRRGDTVPEAWAAAARHRARPVAMTVLATGFALAPLAVALGQGSQLQQPLAIGVIGGFLLSGPIVLLVLPALYCWLDPRGRLGTPSAAVGADIPPSG